MKTLTVVVPCYNSADYMRTSIDSLIPGGEDVEILIVNDGSKDQTAMIADEYAQRYPGVVTVIHKPNGGHGSAINAGLAQATGTYIKVVDSDDWLDADAYATLLDTLRGFRAAGQDLDMVVSNFVYEKVDKKRKAAMRYVNALPQGREFGWDEVRRFRKSQYILMHSLVYRTGLLRDCGLVLPEHTFYVDNLYAFVPLRHVQRMYYLNIDLYRYFIGRSDQSVNESVMIGRVDQQLRINRAMIAHASAVRADPAALPGLIRYLMHYLDVVSVVSSMLLIKSGTRESLNKKEAFWDDLYVLDPALHRRLRRSVLGQLTNLPGRPGRGISVLAYKAARRALGFN